MMKKPLATLLALALLLTPVLAMAEGILIGPNQYTHADNLYSFQYPDGWTVMDKQYIEALVELGSGLEEDENFAQFISQYGSIVEETDMLMLLNEDGATNVSISYYETGMPADDAVLLMMSKGVVEQFRTNMPDVVFLNEGALADIGANRVAMIEYTYTTYGMELYGAQAFISGTDKLYSLTFTSTSDTAEALAGHFAGMLTSLQVQ